MKKLFIAAAAALFTLSACQNDQLQDAVGQDGATVNITANLSSENTRTTIEETGLGNYANRCVLQVYEVGGTTEAPTYTPYGTQTIVAVKDKKATFTGVRLLTGKTYKLVFWADKWGTTITDSKYYNTKDLQKISVKEGVQTLNKDERDAFFGTATLENVTFQDYTENVTLRRPFAQLNLVAKDIKSLPADRMPDKVRVNYTTDVYTEFNAATEQAITPVKNKTFEAKLMNVPTSKDGRYVSMDYIFAQPKPETGEGQLVNFTTTFLKGDKPVSTSKQISNVPIFRNWRTNVWSNYMTAGSDWTVTIDPEFASSVVKYTNDEALKDGGTIMVDQPLDKIDLSSVVENLQGDLDLVINEEVKEIVVGTANELKDPKNVKISVLYGIPFPKITVAEGATYLQNFTLEGNKDTTEPLQGFRSGDLKHFENVTFDGVLFENTGIILGDGVANVKQLNVRNCKAQNLTTAFIKVAAHEYADNIVVENNDINFSEKAANINDRVDGVNIWYMNGGQLTIRNNTQHGGKCFVTSIPSAWNLRRSPDKVLVEGNKVYDTNDAAINIQHPDKVVEIKNNYVRSKVSAISVMFFSTKLDPKMTITGNTFETVEGITSYVMVPFGFNSFWGGNEAGAAAVIVIKDNVKKGVMSSNWAGWMLKNGASTNAVVLKEGSDVAKPYNN